MAEANIKRESYCSIIIIIIMQSVLRRKKKQQIFGGKLLLYQKNRVNLLFARVILLFWRLLTSYCDT
jgi:hypothetical protein